MPHHTINRREILAALLLAPAAAYGLSSADEANLSLEVLVFKQANAAPSALSPLLPMPELARFDASIDKVHAKSVGLYLNSAASALKHQGYETLLHRLWELEAPANARIGLRVDEPKLHATWQIQRGQTLMLHSVLWLMVDKELGYGSDELRRIKLNETHYFDHPYFGAIVQVRARTTDS